MSAKEKEKNSFRHAIGIFVVIGVLIALVVIVSIMAVKT